jgi:hypothetical protein
MMRIGRLNLVAGGVLVLIGFALAAAGPAAMPAFGVGPLPPAAGSAQGVAAEWRLVAFARLFGVGVFMVGAVLMAVGSHIGRDRTRVFAGVVAASSAVAFVVSLAQQWAIWNTTAGATVVVLFAVLALAYGWAAARANAPMAEPEDAESQGEAIGAARGNVG